MRSPWPPSIGIHFVNGVLAGDGVVDPATPEALMYETAVLRVHAWAWKDNPTGAHEDWNPAVVCPYTEGHTH